ncbi:sugar phosphate isomerase/epimerase family protein [Cohnella soli]|uniref:Sugar phosphate isomerase/epimerase family protein n=1 Tax=Cohnella soli TaxID=425005 RepID=A0ABW0HQ82_9BACL
MQPCSLRRISLNQKTTERWNVQEAVEGCVRADVPWIALWREKVAEAGLQSSKRLVRDAGLQVSSLCRGGMFPAATAAERAARLDDNRRAVDEAAELWADVLVLVCGAAPDRDIGSARQWVKEGIAELAPYAKDRGITLGIEPLHPMYAAERSVVVTLAQALDLAEAYPADEVGVIVDVFHVWWDPDLEAQIARAGDRIKGFHVSDWIVPTPDLLMGRGMMGDGKIDIRGIRQLVETAGYGGPIEVEIFNQIIWYTPGDIVLAQMKQRYVEHV